MMRDGDAKLRKLVDRFKGWMLPTWCGALFLALAGVWYASHLMRHTSQTRQVAVGYATPVPEPEPVPVKEPG
jgi:hypothetical protein